MPVIYDRQVAVQIGDRYIEDLRIDFDVTKTVKSAPLNKASITVYNVSEELFEHIIGQRRDIAVQLFVGHTGALRAAYGPTSPPARVFIGNPIKNGVEFSWADADRILKIDAQDGYKAYRKSRLSLSLDADGLTLQEVVAEAASSLGVPLGIVDIPGDVEITQGVTLTGQASVVLDRLAASTGAEWSIQDGTFQFLPRRKARRTRGPRYASELRNIVQYPKLTEEGIKLTVLLDPSITPGDRFDLKVENKRYDGVYKATTVKHTGSKWENTFYTEITARQWTGEVAGDKGAEKVRERIAFADQTEDLRKAAELDSVFWTR